MIDLKRAVAGGAILLSLLLGGCSVHKPMTSVEPSETLPETFSDDGEVPAPVRWWQAMGEEELDLLVDEALAGNLTLLQAWARLDQAGELARIAGAGLYPSVDAVLSGQRRQYHGDLPDTFPPTQSDTVDTFLGTVTVNYQIDLWKKITNSRKAALLNFEAGRRELEATALTISSTVVDLWFSIAEQQATLDLLDEQLDVGQEYLDLVELRFVSGLASAMDVYQQRLQVESTRSQIPRAELQLELLKHQLALLLGRQPTAEIPLPRGELPLLSGLPAIGVPVSVLRNRPDVRAAELRLFAADHQVAVAVADRFPTFSISASAGGQSDTFAEILDGWFTNLAGNILGPVFDAGRRKAEVERNRAVVRERFYGWESVLLVAFREVEDALALEGGLQEINRTNITQLELAELTLERSRARYMSGLTDYLNVLTSLQILQDLQRLGISIRREIISNRIRLYLALGGSWTQDLSRPEPEAAISG